MEGLLSMGPTQYSFLKFGIVNGNENSVSNFLDWEWE